MGFKCGIVGLPNVGKSTLFTALSSAKAEAANYPFCTIEPNVGMVTVPDPRLDKLIELVKPKSIVPSVVKIVDIAGLVRGASQNQGLGNQFLGNIKECEAILHVIRCFEDENIIHVESSVNPVRDKEIIDLELQLKDMELLEKRLDKAKKNTKGGGNKEAEREIEMLQRFIDHINNGKSMRLLETSDDEKVLLEDLSLLTDKPVLYCCNVDEKSMNDGNKFVDMVREAIKGEDADILIICAAFEAQLADIEEPEMRQEFLESYGLKEPGLHQLIRKAYSLLKLDTFFTAGEKEVRAWTIHHLTKAPQAAGVIHTDFEKGFIRAEVIGYDDYVHYKSEAAVKEAGKMRVEGKEYVMKDGDVVHFRFNV